nr:hypothetical protein [Tanacetum cinerariifolium]
MSIEIRKKEKFLQQEQWAYLSTHLSKRLPSFYYDDDDDDEDYTFAITPDEPIFSIEEPDNSLKISSGSTTTHPDISLPEYEAFYDDHVKEISCGSPNTHSDSSLYASFIFYLSINPLPLADRSDFYEFVDKLIPFTSLPEYDCFLFNVEPNSRDFTKDVVEDISPTKEPQVHNALPTHPTLQLNMKFHPSSERKLKKGQNRIKNGKRGEAGKSQKQLQWIEEEKLKKTEKEGPKMQTHSKSYERKKITLAEYMILSGADNRAPMLDKDLYDSWKSRIELYKQNREHERMILKLVENGPLIWPTVEENGVTKTKKYAELSTAEKIQIDCDMKATNIILQGDDLIACLNKIMAFLTDVASSSYKSNATSLGGNTTSGQVRVVKCYNCQGEQHMARQCTQPKRLRNAAWYKDKAMLAKAQEAGEILDKSNSHFLQI